MPRSNILVVSLPAEALNGLLQLSGYCTPVALHCKYEWVTNNTRDIIESNYANLVTHRIGLLLVLFVKAPTTVGKLVSRQISSVRKRKVSL